MPIPAIEVNFVSASYTVTEGEAVRVCVRLESSRLERNLQLSIFSQEHTAEADADYVPLNSTILIHDENYWCINVTTLNDNVVEGEEVLLVVLISNDPTVVTPTPLSTYVNIQDSTSKLYSFN